MNAICIELPNSVRAHDVVHVEHTKSHYIQPPEIDQDHSSQTELYTDHNGYQVIEIGTIISYRLRGWG